MLLIIGKGFFFSIPNILNNVLIYKYLNPISRATFSECNSGVCFAVFKELNRVLADTSRVVMALTQKTVRERLAETFLRLDEELGTDMYGFIRVLFTREELANFVGAATESLIRLISEFKSAHLIEVSRRRIKILDRKRMTEIARVV